MSTPSAARPSGLAVRDHPAVPADTQVRAVAERLGVTAAAHAMVSASSTVQAVQPAPSVLATRKPGISPSCERA
jgi:hypothetical protein